MSESLRVVDTNWKELERVARDLGHTEPADIAFEVVEIIDQLRAEGKLSVISDLVWNLPPRG